MRVLSLVVLALATLLVSKSSSHSVSSGGHQNEMRIVRTAEVFHDLEEYKRREAKSDKQFVVDGKVYQAAYDTTRPHIALAFMDGSSEQHLSIKGERDYYSDAENHAVFTVSRRVAEDGRERRSLRANILLPGSNEHLVLEPHEESAEMNTEGFHMYSKIYKTSNKRPYDIANATVAKDFVRTPSSSKQPASTPGAVNNVVELFMVADNWYYQAVVKRLGKSDDASVGVFIEAYFAQVEYLASQCYVRSLASTPNLKLSVVATQIYILKNAQSSPFTSSDYMVELDGSSADQAGKYYVHAEAALDALNSWATSTFKGKNYDSVVGITGSNIVSIDDGMDYPTSDGLVGLAPMGGVCQKGYNAFIVEDWLDYSRAYTVAHELGHNLGADHDDAYNSDACTDEDFYIMAPINQDQNFLNSFYFSPCSINIFVQRIYSQNQAKCLANPVQPDADINRFASFFPGQIYNLTQQCQLEFDSSFVADLPQGYDDPSTDGYVCKNILCIQEGKLTVTSRSYSFRQGYTTPGSPAYERTSCGNGKWCVAGKCQADPAAPKGDIPVDSLASCSQIAKYFGNSYVCKLYYGACYLFCNPGSTVIKPLSTQTMANWLATNTVDNTRIL